MDPLSIAGMVLAVGQTIGPIINGIRVVLDYQNINDNIKAALKRSIASAESIQVWVDVLKDLDDVPIDPDHKKLLLRKFHELQVASQAHFKEVNGWRVRLTEKERRRSSSSNLRPSVEGVKFLYRAKHYLMFWRSSAGRFGDGIANVAGKASYALVGEHNVNRLASDLQYWDTQLFQTYITVSGATHFRSLKSPKNPDALHPIVRFLEQARDRQTNQRPIHIIEHDVWKKYYDTPFLFKYVDKNTVHSTGLYQILVGDAIPNPADPGLRSYKDCVYIERGRITDELEQDSMKLARLFAEDDEDIKAQSDQFFGPRREGDMLRCCAVAEADGMCFLLFKLPPGSSRELHTLRTLLLDQRCFSPGTNILLHPLPDRAKLAVRLATSVLTIHSLGLVHKRINPETILVVDSLSTDPNQVFPKRLGYPYLVAFHLARSDVGTTDLLSNVAELGRRGIYFHPRDQAERRGDRYRMHDDIFSLGVCLFEIALWRSLFVWSKERRDYIHDDSFIALSDETGKWTGMDMSEKAAARTRELIRAAEELIPGTMGPTFAKAVVACLKAGTEDNPFVNHTRMKSAGQSTSIEGVNGTPVENPFCDETKPVSVKYLELVLENLNAVYNGMLSSV